MKKKHVEETLFDQMESEPEPEPEPGEWQEVPQARFLSWSIPMQLQYCAARDLDSAGQDGADINFYLDRRDGYLKDMQ